MHTSTFQLNSNWLIALGLACLVLLAAVAMFYRAPEPVSTAWGFEAVEDFQASLAVASSVEVYPRAWEGDFTELRIRDFSFAPATRIYDLEALRAALFDPALIEPMPHGSALMCGGFNPSHAVRWRGQNGRIYTILLDQCEEIRMLEGNRGVGFMVKQEPIIRAALEPVFVVGQKRR